MSMEQESQLNHPPEPVKEYGQGLIEEGDLVRWEGKLHRAVKFDTGYTVRQYYSHETKEKGPGPGWDWRWPALEKYGVNDPSELPDEPCFKIKLVPVEEKGQAPQP